MLNYKDKKTAEISFPLGGIRSGSVSLGGNGQLIDWEIFNRPNKGSYNEYTNFAVKAERGGKVVDARILAGDLQTSMMGDKSKSSHHSWGYGHGPNRTTLAGFAHFSDFEFDGKFPIAVLKYKEEKFPGEIKLRAFNPFIPSDDKNSSIPAAFFEWEILNTTHEDIDYTIAFSCGNPQKPCTENNFYSSSNQKGIVMNSKKNKSGSVCIATDCDDVSYQEYWYRSGWFDDVTMFWREFSEFGKLKNRRYEDHGKAYGRLDIGDMCTLAAHISVKAGETGKIRFVLSWYYPKYGKYWSSSPFKPSWNNYYASLFKSAREVAEYSVKNFDNLLEKTQLFKDCLYSSSMPDEALEAVAANLAVLKSTTCMRLEDGTFYAFEGVNADSGSCEGSCTHVWNYAYALPFLFPSLERSMRDADYKYNLCKDGKMCFRIMLPLGSKKWNFHACVDGQFGGIIKLYRDWKISGDDEFLKRNWQSAKKAIEYAWSDKNPDKWDPQKTGVISGRQHHTLDVELFGVNAWLTGFYIAGLCAGAEIAQYLGDDKTANEYREIAEKGKKYVDERLWNGRYFVQEVNIKDKDILKPYEKKDKNIYAEYWNDEKGEIKYQIADGCEIDMLVSQWHSDLCGLGDVFDRGKTSTALKSLYDINFKSMRDVFNPCRIFALNDEKGLLICNWDETVYKPQIPIPYSEEVMTGFEYAAAALMINRGLENEGMEIVKSVRERYNGEKRNPYAEIECGSSYARSMASYSLLLLFSGFKYDMPKKAFGFEPLHPKVGYKTFWSVDGAWGTFEIKENCTLVSAAYGKLELREFTLPTAFSNVQKILIGEESVPFKMKGNEIVFNSKVEIASNMKMKVVFA